MTHEGHKVVMEVQGLRIIIANSATSLTKANRNDIVVHASHCGANIAPDYILPSGALGMIGNDAGIGLANAGVASLKTLEERGIPAAAVAADSAEIGVGKSTYDEGVISAVNDVAKKMGVQPGMTAKAAADRMLRGILKQKG